MADDIDMVEGEELVEPQEATGIIGTIMARFRDAESGRQTRRRTVAKSV